MSTYTLGSALLSSRSEYARANGGRYGIRIDTLLRQELDDLFTSMGLADLLH